MRVSNTTDQELIDRFIELDSSGARADARVTGYGVHVWALVGYWQANGRDIDLVARDYELPREAVEAALAFYECHREIIDDRMQANVIPSGNLSGNTLSR
jgi:uncharacterized protein (DUF433 family)